MLITLEGKIEEDQIYMVDLKFMNKEGRILKQLKSQVYTMGNHRVKRWCKAARLTTGNDNKVKPEVFEIRVMPVKIISSKV